MTDGAALFGRVAVLDLQDRRITGLRIAFRIEKGLTRTPNKAEVTVYNLSEATRGRLANGLTTHLKLIAGYGDTVEQIFIGDVVKVSHTRDGTEWASRFSVGDGEKKLRGAKVNKSIRNATAGDALKAVGESLGVGAGNLVDQVKAGDYRKAITSLGNLVMSGFASDELDKVTTTLGLEWSVQDGNLQIMPIGAVVGTDVVVLSPATGLEGSPEIGEKGTVKAKARIQQRLVPGRRVRLQDIATKQLEGFYRIEKVLFVGDTHGAEWTAELELKIVRS